MAFPYDNPFTNNNKSNINTYPTIPVLKKVLADEFNALTDGVNSLATAVTAGQYLGLATASPPVAPTGQARLRLAAGNIEVSVSGAAYSPIAGTITVGTFGTVPNAQGASVSGSQLTIQPASASYPGAVSAIAQTFAGVKTFTGEVVVPDIKCTPGTAPATPAEGQVYYDNSGHVLKFRNASTWVDCGGTGTSVTVAPVGTAPNANAATLTGQALNLELASAAFPGLVSAAQFTKLANTSGTNTGDITATVIGSTPNANGFTLTGQAVTLQPADGTYGGVLNTTSQTIAGVKTFTTIQGHTGLDGSQTVGATQIDAPCGVSTIASGATTCVVTNSLATAFCKVTLEWYGDHGATRSWVVRANGSFTVTLSSAAAANTSFGWEVSGMTSTMLNGLIHYWPLDGNSNDVFTTGNGTDTAVTYTTPKLGNQCAAFNGDTSKVITSGTGMVGAAPRSISLWIKPSGSNRAAFTDGTGVGTRLALFRNSATSFMMTDGAAGHCVNTAATADGVWSHVVFTYSGTVGNLYINGGAPVSETFTMNTSAGAITIGDYFGAAANRWFGLIDDTVMWDRALDAGEVATLYNAGAGLETMSGSLLTGLIHQWHLNGSSVDNVGTANGTDTAVTYGGKSGQCAMFNGTTSKIQTAVNGPLGAAARSISCWFKPSVLGINADMLSYGGAGTGTCFSIRQTSSNTIMLSIGGVVGPSPAGTVAVGVWHHVVATYDGITMKCYLNGGVPATMDYTLITSAFAIQIGTSIAAVPTNGLIDEPAMWNRVLTAAEVTALHNAGAGRYYPSFA